ncbi:MAG: R3H domain-containing nucleic acid-binding protein [Acidobacteriota bacterium]
MELCVERILDVMDLEIEYTITDGDVMELEFSGEDSEYLVEDNGKVLKAIEHIVPRTVRGLIGRSVSVNADCDGFRADHEDSLRQAAEDLAREVSRSGKPKSMSPMNPADRRIVHLTLVDDPEVDTISQGHGFMKRVKIVPAS